MISVIVPAYNSACTLGRCLEALAHQSIPRSQYEIIVVDDGSTDETASMVEAAGAQVIRQSHRGPAAARNRGVQAARGETILFTDSDCEPLPNWIERMTAPFVDPCVMGVKGAYRCGQHELMARLAQAEFEDKYARLRRHETIDFIDTYSAAYRRDVFLQAGGFDETFPLASVEDVELSFRLAEQGARLIFAPEAQVWHAHVTSLIHYMRRKARYGFWRALVYRWHPGKIRGDSYTDPILKVQFTLAGLSGLGVLAALADARFLLVTLLAGLALAATTLPFAVRTWRCDRLAALMAPPVHALRAIVQVGALAIGLLVHSLPGHRSAGPRRGA